MKIHIPALAVWPLLLIPLVIGIVAMQLYRPAPGPSVRVQPPPEADYYLRDAELRAMNEDGELMYVVRADNVLHFPDDTVALDRVRVEYLEGPWQLAADRGLMTPGAVRLDLSGAVQMRGTLQSQDRVHLSTPKLSVYFEERRIDTDAPVRLHSGAYAARATGMRTDMDGRELALVSDVRVEYEP